MAITFNGVNLSPTKQLSSSNYLDIQADGWTKQYLPELYEAEAEIYGDRSVAGFLKMVGAEMPMASDQVIWSEQGRLHLSYTGATVTNAGVIDIAGSGTHAVRVGQTIVLSDNQASPTVIKCYVSAVASDGTTLTVLPYTGGATVGAVAGFDTVDDNAANTCSFFVFGSEFAKGTDSMDGAVEPQFTTYTNSPIILKDHYGINGSDTAQIGWVEITGEAGESGYLWYVKAEGETRTRFEDYLEMSLVEAELNTGGASGFKGSEGLFAAITDRGHVHAGGLDGSSAADDLTDFDDMLKLLDKQGAIEENVLFLNRELSLNFDDMLAAQNRYGTGGISWGVFNNSEDMAINLGFSGFRRGSYDFYKTDWKYLNDGATRGSISGGVTGVLVPAGTSTVYDQILGKNLKRPFLHVRYRASETDNRRMKTWITGSVGGATNSSFDTMDVHYLSERCLVVQGANNFVLMTA